MIRIQEIQEMPEDWDARDTRRYRVTGECLRIRVIGECLRMK
jgi:hypothetical protein